MAISVREVCPASVISMIRCSSRIRLRISAVLKTMVSTNPSLDPRRDLSLSGSSTLLAGYVLVSMAMHDAYPSINRQLTPESTFRSTWSKSDRTSTSMYGTWVCENAAASSGISSFVTPINESSSFSIASSFTKPSIK